MLNRRDLQDLLTPTVFGPVNLVASTGSTNEDLLSAAAVGAPEGAVLVAGHQTAGRGRRGRSWLAPPGAALLASVLLRPPSGFSPALLSPAAALAVRDACATLGAEARLKWPNDVIVEPVTAPSRPADDLSGGAEPGQPAAELWRVSEAKLAGVLAESQTQADGSVATVVGFGVNLRSQSELAAAVTAGPTRHPDDEYAPLPPVALESVVGRPVDRDCLLVSVLRRLDAWYRRLRGPGGEAHLLTGLRRHSATLGREVSVLTQRGRLEGTAVDLTEGGALMVATAAGPVTVNAGDCRHLRADPA